MHIKRLKKNILKYLIHHKKQRSVVVFIVLLVLALTSTYIVQLYLSFQIESTQVSTNIEIDNESFYPQPFIIETNGPTYFNSYASVRYIVISRFGNIFQNSSISASLDNSTWVDVPLAYNQSDLNAKKPANLGLVKLDSPTVTIYLKVHLPPQLVIVHFNVTKDFVMDNNFVGNINITPVPSSLDAGKTIFSFFVLFGAIFIVYNFFKSRYKESTNGKKQAMAKKRKRAKIKRLIYGGQNLRLCLLACS